MVPASPIPKTNLASESMNRFWELILRKLLEAVRARCVIEVGVASGLLTEKVLEYCTASGAVLHAIDPSPQVDVDEWRGRYGDRLVFHEALSLDVLGGIHDVDAVFIDGDHNWYTVYHELILLEATALNDGRLPPVIALHDVGWPYGRRDMYYNPETIPEAYRQPYRRLGLVPGEMEPVDGGINRDLANAIVEDSARNGVRTAVEDFTAQSQLAWEVVYIPGFHGLGIAASDARLADNDELRRTIESVEAGELLLPLARELEIARIPSEIEANRALSESLETLERRLKSEAADRLAHTDRLQELLVDAERRLAGIPDLHVQIAELGRELSEARRDAASAREETGVLEQRLTIGEQVLADVFGSPSWRVTRPLRVGKRVVMRLREAVDR